MLVTELLALPAEVLAVELALDRAAQRERDDEIRLMESRLHDDKLGIARILNTLIRIYRES